ncbi:alpha/beta hydrolase [Salipiger bermudensis]|uniref:alpha/beta hydrolase n=1 Tax=Salipiger bermudensis TaxID=344736 RepID=UPI001A90B408|nr:alpha/beta hydrolase [Salipiger bermudensis]MBN9674301.1 alpha/beta hydrolase [Salipiger bermudensis]MBR9890297.1 alpha/beta hydrolase [bacterium]MCA1286326.1 alpha/beta hydrolase [Salipiger bermudensis]
MPRRAIVLVPGFGRNERNLLRDRLVRALRHYTDGWRIEQLEDGDGARAGAARLRATARCGGESREIDVYEAYWADLVPDWSRESPWARFKRGGLLLRYWLFGGARAWRDRGEAPPRAATAMRLAALALILWWLVVALLLLQTFGAISIPEAFAAIPGFEKLWAQISVGAAAVTGSVLAGLLLWVWSLGYLEQFANISAYAKAYLRDEPCGDDDIGLRAKTKARALQLLDQVGDVSGDRAYDEIYVVGHSLGGAIAVDALADYGDRLDHVVLFTWGSALGLLSQQEPLVECEIGKFYEARPRIRGWIDVVFPQDYMGSQVPVPRRIDAAGKPGAFYDPLFPKAVTPHVPRGMHLFELADIHEAYYRCEKALLMLVQPGSALPVAEQAPPGPAAKTVTKLRVT